MSFNCFGGSYATNYTRTCSTQSTNIPTKTNLGGCATKTSEGLLGASWFQGSNQNLQNLLGGLVGKIDTNTSASQIRTCGTESPHSSESSHGCGGESHHTSTHEHHQLATINQGLPDNDIADEIVDTTAGNSVIVDNGGAANANIMAQDNANANSAVATAVNNTAS